MAIGTNPYAPGAEEYQRWEDAFGKKAVAGSAASAGVTPAAVTAEQERNIQFNPDEAAANARQNQMAAATGRQAFAGASEADFAPSPATPGATGTAGEQPSHVTLYNDKGEAIQVTNNPQNIQGFMNQRNLDGTAVWSTTKPRPVLDQAGQGGTTEMAGAAGLTEAPKMRTEEEIRQQEIQQAQALIDATQGLFQENLLDVTRRGNEALMQQRAISTGAGLAGSPFAPAQGAKVEQATAREERAVRAERQAQVAQIMANAMGRATDRYDREIQRFQQEREFAVSERDKMIAEQKAKAEAARVQATDTVKNLAQAGIALSEMDQAEYQKLLSDSGMSEFEAHAVWSASTPEAGGEVTVQNGQLVNTYFDPATQRPVVKVSPLPPELQGSATAKYKTQVTNDGTVLLIPDEFDPNLPIRDQIVTYGTFAKPESPEAVAKREKAAQAEEQQQSARLEAAQGKLDLIKQIEENEKGLRGSVGTYGISRWTPFSMDKAERKAFDSAVQQLVSQETLDSLINVKAQGGTFGALSETELAMLKNSATQINSWMKMDGEGNPTGVYEIDRETFMKEVDRIKNLTEKAIKRANGELPPPENPRVLDAEYENVIQNVSQEDIDMLKSEFPDMTEDEIIRQLGEGFNQEGSGSENALGTLSEKYESGGNPGAIGYDSTGGYSYGAYQLAHNNAKRFAEQSPYAKEFSGLTFNSKAWRDKWKEVAQKDPEGFKRAQKDYIAKTHYEPQIDRLARAGIDTSNLSQVMKDVIWSTAVQHGANTDVIEKAMKRAGPNASDEEIIKNIYEERWSGGRRFASSTPSVRQAVKNRFDSELSQALSMLG